MAENDSFSIPPVATEIERELTSDEKISLGHEAAKLNREVKQLLEDMDASKKDFGARLKVKHAKINDLLEQIDKGKVSEMVKCDIYLDLPTRGRKVFWDSERLRLVKTENMNTADKQNVMFDYRQPPKELLDFLKSELGKNSEEE